MYRLYWSPGAASLAVHWMLRELDVPFALERADIDSGQNRSPDYLRLNPEGKVPTLIVDGAPVRETAALLMLLAERHPQAGLAPAVGAPDRAAWLEWMLYLANTLLPAFRLWFYPDDLKGADHDAVRTTIEAAFDRIDAHLAGRRFMIGDGLTTVDVLAAMLMRWSRNMPRPATRWPGIAAYLEGIRARPALRETHRAEGLSDWIDG